MSDTQQVTSDAKKLPEGYYLQLLVSEDTTDFLDVWRVIKAGKLAIFVFLVLFLLLGALLSFIIPRNYAAEVIVAITDTTLDVGSSSDSSDTVDLTVSVSSKEALAMLESRIFINQFLVEEDLLPILFHKQWDNVSKQWKEEEEAPTIWEAYEKFSEDILDIETDEETGLTSVTVTWINAELAAYWANELIRKINIQLRDRAIAQANTSISYLDEQLAKTSAVELQQALYGLMEVQLAKIVAAKVQEEYAFRIVDPALVPEELAVPHLLAILLSVFGFLGIFFGISFVWFRYSIHQMAMRKK
jgi:uncharacterized protein involved in exopolysaccharide biosynthesis